MATAPDSPLRLESLEALAAWREAQQRPVCFVPTMGNLHAGHVTLVEAAAGNGAAVIASIFVNPAQFGPDEDYERYPRTLDEDLIALASAGCDSVWLPSDEAMYPLPRAQGFSVNPPEALVDCLCGARRPGHFEGVCNVVMRLMWQVRPDRAVFGEKDYQQLLIIRQMARDFSLPVAVDAVATVREPDGLAMSSRNRYLSDAQRSIAPELYQTLRRLAASAEADSGTFEDLRRSSLLRLDALGFRPEYIEIRNAETLGPADGKNDRIFAAAHLGRARLIDNVAVTRQTCL